MESNKRFFPAIRKNTGKNEKIEKAKSRVTTPLSTPSAGADPGYRFVRVQVGAPLTLKRDSVGNQFYGQPNAPG